MKSTIRGTDAFRYIACELDPGETLITESGAMASMSAELDCKARLNGGFLKGLIRKYLGGESLFVNHFTNNTERPLQLVLTSSGPGDVCAFELNDSSICLEPGSYICSTSDVSLGIRYAGISSFIAREGLFKLVLSGTGTVWFGGYGGFIEREIDGEFIVDSGHLVAYDPTISLRTQLSSGIFGSFFSGEGFVTRLEGKGRVWLQTRSLSGLAGWINPRL
jgi:uncharacterized protein (TIGR00266 family)